MEIRFRNEDLNIDNDLILFLEEAEHLVKEAGIKSSVKARQELREKSPKRFGDYAKGWGYSTKYTVAGGMEYVIWNKKYFSLVHLLEDGHDIIRNGVRVGRASPIKHYQDTVNKVGDYYVRYIEDGLQKLE